MEAPRYRNVLSNLIPVFFLFAAAPALAWISVPDAPTSYGRSVAVDAAGDVLVAGRLDSDDPAPDSHGFCVVKFSGADGTELWQSSITNDGEAKTVAVDSAGDVVVGGTVDSGNPGPTQWYLAVAKFSGVDGTELWRRTLPANSGVAWDIVFDSSGNPLVAGERDNAVTISKLAAATGAVVWEYFNGSNYSGGFRAISIDGPGNIIAAGDGVMRIPPTGFGPGMWGQYSSGSPWNVHANGVAVDASGNPVVAGWSPIGASDRSFTVVKLAIVDGSVLWRRDISGSAVGQADAQAVKMDAGGDVIAGGVLLEGGNPGHQYTVMKLNGADGSDLWRFQIAGGRANDVAVDSAGNVIAAGELSAAEPSPGQGIRIVKLRGSDGVALWQRSIGKSGDETFAVALDGDDVVAAGIAALAGTVTQMVAIKLSADGSESGPACGDLLTEGAEQCDDGGLVDGDGCSALCREEPICGNSQVEAGEECDDGNVVSGDGCSSSCVPEQISSELTSDPAAAPGVEITTDAEGDGATMMDPLETAVIPAAGGLVSIFENPAPTPSARYRFLGWDVDLVIPAATTENPNLIVFRIDPSLVPDGENEATIVILKDAVAVLACDSPTIASPDPCVASRQVLVDGDIEIAVRSSTASLWQLVVKPASQLLTGKKLAIKDDPDSARRKILWKASADLLAIGVPGSVNDPTCSGDGDAVLEIYNPGSGESALFALPCESWTVVGEAGAEKGYRYKDKELAFGPVSQVTILDGKKILAKAAGTQVTYTLDEAQQGLVAVALTTGAGASYCTAFGGNILKDVPGSYSAVSAPPPLSCP